MATEFIRTASGLRNEHLFYNVDFVVYLEGGAHSYTLDEVINQNRYDNNTLDIAFWGNIFTHYLKNKKPKFKSIGSKPVLKQIANMLVSNDINGTLVCMDTDFDELLANRIDDKRVFYTYGYSWENEVFNLSVIQGVTETLTAISPCSTNIEARFKRFLADIEEGVKSDYILFQNNLSFLPRDGGRLKYIDMDNVSLPVKKDLLHTDINSRGISELQLARVNDILVEKHCFGHLIADYAYELFKRHAKEELKLPFPSRELFNRSAISLYFQKFPVKNDIDSFYKIQFIRIGV